MSRASALLFVGLLAVLSSWALEDAAPDAAAEEGEIAGVAWLTDLEGARAKAAEEGRPLLVVFR